MNSTSWFENALTWLFPRLLIQGTKWEAEWQARERASFRNIFLVASPIVAALYLGHYFFYDVPMGLEPLDRWFALRTTIAGLWSAAFLVYLTPFSKVRYYKIPAMIVAGATCVSQSLVMLWYGEQSWVFGFIMVTGATLLLRMPIVSSVVFSFAVIASQSLLYLEAGLSVPDILTGTMVTLGMILILRSSYAGEIRYYLLNKENADAQERISELNSELAQRVQAFIPKVIATRMNNAIENERTTVTEASINVLRPTHRSIACLHSDIRGFTQSSKDLEKFVYKSVIPEVKACSEAIERFDGVPRKIGDLVFAYFDSENVRKNVSNALLAAFAIAQLNKDMNETSTALDVKRYILISAGDAIVGNIGGLDSSIEITALGPPVNFLNRLDGATKAPALAKLLSHGDILLGAECLELMPEIADLNHEIIELSQLGISIRDYNQVGRILKVSPTEANLRRLREGVSTGAELTERALGDQELAG